MLSWLEYCQNYDSRAVIHNCREFIRLSIGLLFDWIGFNQTQREVPGYLHRMLLNPNYSNFGPCFRALVTVKTLKTCSIKKSMPLYTWWLYNTSHRSPVVRASDTSPLRCVFSVPPSLLFFVYFQTFSNKHWNAFNNIMWKISSIQDPVLGFKPTTSWTQVSFINHQTRAPARSLYF